MRSRCNARRSAMSAFALIVLAATSLCGSTEAATLSLYKSHGGRVISVFLRGEELNDSIAAVRISFRGPAGPLGDNSFANMSSGRSGGVPFPAGLPFTYRNRALDLDPLDLDNPGVGKGWTILSSTQNSTELSFGGFRVGGAISTASEPRGELFLANLYSGVEDPFSHGFFTTLQLRNEQGAVLFSGSYVLSLLGPGALPQLPEVPEPSSVALLAAAALAALVGRRRTSRVHVSNPVT
jgi:hypothetical protein